MTDQCVCSHVLDEHDEALECTIDGCMCGYYEAAGDDDDR